MRDVLFVMSLLFVGILGCGTTGNSPSEATTVGGIAGGDSQANVCPQICGLGTQCRYPDGSCTEACNPCLCMAAGGTVVTSCPKQESPRASTAQASMIADNSFVGGACNPTE